MPRVRGPGPGQALRNYDNLIKLMIIYQNLRHLCEINENLRKRTLQYGSQGNDGKHIGFSYPAPSQDTGNGQPWAVAANPGPVYPETIRKLSGNTRGSKKNETNNAGIIHG